jgi:hypothetical protein
MGFSKVDVQIGHDLAGQGSLSRMAAALGAILCNKYRRQIGAGCWVELVGKKD